MQRIAIINQKGGVGKTTTTVNLGAALARSGARVLLIDLDPQGHLTLHLGAEVAEGDSSIYDVLTSGTSILSACVDVGDNLKLLPADIDLAAAESELVSVTGREVLLREAVDAVADEFDHLLIDCPPSLGVLTVNALVACDDVVIPLQAQFFALQGLSRLFDTVSLVNQRINPALSVSGVVLCMHEAQTRLSNEVVADLTGFLEGAQGGETPWAQARIFDTRIRRNVKLAEASGFGQSIFDYAPRSNGALDYANLSDEIFGAPAMLVTRESLASAESAFDVAEAETMAETIAKPRAAWSSTIRSTPLEPTAAERNVADSSVPSEGECADHDVDVPHASPNGVRSPDVQVRPPEKSGKELSTGTVGTGHNGRVGVRAMTELPASSDADRPK